MSDADGGLFSIEVDADNYAESAAGDTPSVPRTFQSEADFQIHKAAYVAKIDGGISYQDLVTAVPILAFDDDNSSNGNPNSAQPSACPKVPLSKRDGQRLGYAVAELYYDRQYGGVIELCERVRARCEVDVKTAESLRRWISRSREKLPVQ